MPSERLWREHKEHPPYCTCADCCEARLSGTRYKKVKGRGGDKVTPILIVVAVVIIVAIVIIGSLP